MLLRHHVCKLHVAPTRLRVVIDVSERQSHELRYVHCTFEGEISN